MRTYEQQHHLQGIFWLGVCLLSFAFTHVFQKMGINSGVEPSTLSFFSVFSGLIFLSVIWLSAQKRANLRIQKRHIKNLVLIGVLTSGLGVALGIYALSFTSATNKSIMQPLITGCTMIIAYFWLHERLPKSYIPAFLSVVFGVVLFTSKGFLQAPNFGDYLLLLTVPIAGFCNVFAKRTMKDLHPLTVSVGRLFFGGVFLLLVFMWFGLDQIQTLFLGLPWVICAGIASATKVATLYRAIDIEGPTIAASVITVSPVITAVSDYFLVGTPFTTLQIIGLLIAVIGAIFIARMKASYKKG